MFRQAFQSRVNPYLGRRFDQCCAATECR